MQIRGSDGPNYKNKHSSVFLLIKNHKIDTELACVANLVQKSQPQWILGGGHIGFCRHGQQNASLQCPNLVLLLQTERLEDVGLHVVNQCQRFLSNVFNVDSQPQCHGVSYSFL